MIKNKKPYLIDFQGGREGPVQYDLASLMIDPYTELSPDIQRQLVDYCHDRLTSYIHVDKKKFYLCYEYCTITRNLQILGAFGYLSKVKGKKYFEKYIPAAVKSLENNLTAFEDPEFPVLKSTLLKITEQKDIMLGCFA
jgi:aminoglycoside/choline kinase family phosphotransferase